MLTKVRPDGESHPFMRSAGTFSIILFLLFLAWFSIRTGFASLLSTYAASQNDPAASEAATRLSPRDADVRHIRGAVLEAGADLAAANEENTEAVRLRPGDYVLWLSLAHTRELTGDTAGAVAADRQAVQLAPFYGQPHWQLGNLLVRAGRFDEGFSELRLAAASNKAMLPAIIDLAWQMSHGDAGYVRRAIAPASPEVSLALAEYFKHHGAVTETIDLLRSAPNLTADFRRQYTAELISTGHFEEAYALWSIAHPPDPAAPLVAAPGFEVETDLDEPGFGWRAQKDQGFGLSLDEVNPREGKASLKVDFHGESHAGLAIISQLVRVASRAHYRLHFSARTEEIVSGGLPHLSVLNAGTSQALGQSDTFPLNTNGWRDYAVEFTVPESTSTIQITLQREGCAKVPCPIFGRLWLDKFSLEKL